MTKDQHIKSQEAKKPQPNRFDSQLSPILGETTGLKQFLEHQNSGSNRNLTNLTFT